MPPPRPNCFDADVSDRDVALAVRVERFRCDAHGAVVHRGLEGPAPVLPGLEAQHRRDLEIPRPVQVPFNLSDQSV
jgi:hypothetical protein